MSKSVDWYYHRKNCSSCTKMRALLDARGVESNEVVIANKVRFEADEAVQLIRKSKRLVGVKGKRIVDLKLTDKSVTDDMIQDIAIGPSGKLRAPAIRVGTTFLIGFHESAFDDFLG
ncbi:MAG: hypothetical protein KDA88_14115 [Planctomycetaceae bacterium]|nr:hypothetical protein [Planctomycetaceae bacterium]MCB9952002.1 hypothetical protein [Planctomycetaceae bacterium]